MLPRTILLSSLARRLAYSTTPAIKQRLIDAVIAKFLLNTLTSGVVATVLFSSIILYDGLYVTLSPGPLVAGFLLAALLGLGVGAGERLGQRCPGADYSRRQSRTVRFGNHSTIIRYPQAQLM